MSDRALIDELADLEGWARLHRGWTMRGALVALPSGPLTDAGVIEMKRALGRLGQEGVTYIEKKGSATVYVRFAGKLIEATDEYAWRAFARARIEVAQLQPEESHADHGDP